MHQTVDSGRCRDFFAELRWELFPAAAAQWLTPLTGRCAHAFTAWRGENGRNLMKSCGWQIVETVEFGVS